MTIEMVGELFDLAGKLVFNQETSVVILGSASPEFFIAHSNLNDMFRALNDPDVPQSKYDDINVLQALTTMWEALPQVTIALVDGICRGGGLEFLLAAHMRFATPESLFCFPEASGGFLLTGGGTTRLALQLGPARAREVLLSARDFTGEEAASYGLVNRALPADDICAYVDDLALRLAARSAGTVASVNQVLTKVYSGAVDAQFAGFAVENEAMRTLLAVQQPSNPAPSARLVVELDHDRSSRPGRWRDRQRQVLDETVGMILGEIEARALEDAQRRASDEQARVEREARWRAAMEDAKERAVQDQLAEVHRDETRRWREPAAARHRLEWAASKCIGDRPLRRLPKIPTPHDPTPDQPKPYLKGWSRVWSPIAATHPGRLPVQAHCATRAKDKARMEGKGYVMQDGMSWSSAST